MKRPEDLAEVTENLLHGLTADDSLKQRILQRAADYSGTEQKRVFHPVPVFGSVIFALIIAVVLLNGLPPVVPAQPAEMKVFAAGSQDTVPPAADEGTTFVQTVFGGVMPGDVVSVELDSTGLVSDPEQCRTLISVLCENAEPSVNVSADKQSRLTITTAAGEVYQLAADEPYLTGSGCWSCPGFFSLMRQFCGK